MMLPHMIFCTGIVVNFLYMEAYFRILYDGSILSHTWNNTFAFYTMPELRTKSRLFEIETERERERRDKRGRGSERVWDHCTFFSHSRILCFQPRTSSHWRERDWLSVPTPSPFSFHHLCFFPCVLFTLLIFSGERSRHCHFHYLASGPLLAQNFPIKPPPFNLWEKLVNPAIQA